MRIARSINYRSRLPVLASTLPCRSSAKLFKTWRLIVKSVLLCVHSISVAFVH